MKEQQVEEHAMTIVPVHIILFILEQKDEGREMK
jgi:hypothetical protein